MDFANATSADISNGTLPLDINNATSSSNQGGFCSLCPGGFELPLPNRTFIGGGNDGDSSLSCGDLDDILKDIQSREDCEATQQVFNVTFNPSIYCHCPRLEPNSICSLCPTTDRMVLGNNAQRMINGASCSDYLALANAATTLEFCQSILDVEGIEETCCEEGNITTTTTTTLMDIEEEDDDELEDDFFTQDISKSGQESESLLSEKQSTLTAQNTMAMTSDGVASLRRTSSSRQQLLGLGLLTIVSIVILG